MGVKNGQTGTIVGIEGQKNTVETAGKNLVFDAGEYKHFDHGYVLTTCKAQGITKDRVIINLDSSQEVLNNRNSYYVDISRARNKVSIYVDNQGKMSNQVSRFVKKISSHDFLQEQDFVTKKQLLRIKPPISSVNMHTQALEAKTDNIINMMEKTIKGIQEDFKRKMGIRK